MFRDRPAAVLLVLLAPTFGCQSLQSLLQNLVEPAVEAGISDQVERESGAKRVLGGNAERAVLVNIESYFGLKEPGEPVVLDLASGARTATGVDLQAVSTFYGGDSAAVQTDGDYLAWGEPLNPPDATSALQVLDLRSGEQRRLWENWRFDGLTVTKWVLNGGRIIARATQDHGDATVSDPPPWIGNLIHDLATGETRRVPAAEFDVLHGSSAFTLRHIGQYEPLDGGGSIFVSTESLLRETDLDTGVGRTLLSLPAAATFQSGLATATHVVWQEVDFRATLSIVTFYDRQTGALGTFERRQGAFGYTELQDVGDAGCVIVSSVGLPFLAGDIRYEFIDWDGRSTLLQRGALTRAPVNGRAAILGDRVIWNDFDDGRLRYYVISTGERGAYE